MVNFQQKTRHDIFFQFCKEDFKGNLINQISKAILEQVEDIKEIMKSQLQEVVDLETEYKVSREQILVKDMLQGNS